MRKAFKIFGITIAIFVLLIIILSIFAKVNEKEITNIALKKIGESVKAPISIDDISFNLIRKFPLATIELRGVRLGSELSYKYPDSTFIDSQTLAKINQLNISVKTKPLFKGEFEVVKIGIKGVDCKYRVDSLGVSNFDFILNSFEADTTKGDTTGSKLPSIVLTELEIEDVSCLYSDDSKETQAQLNIPELEINGLLKGEEKKGEAKGGLYLTNCRYQDSPLKLMQNTSVSFDVKYSGDSVVVEEVYLMSDGAKLYGEGTLLLADTLYTELSLEGEKLDINELAKYIPGNLTDSIQLKHLSGIVNLKSHVKGLLIPGKTPSINASFSLNRGSVHVAHHPRVSNVVLMGTYTNGKLNGAKTSQIDLKKFHAETQYTSVDLSARLKNFEAPGYNISLAASGDIKEITPYLPDSIINTAEGNVHLKLNTKGKLPKKIDISFIDYLLENSNIELGFEDLNLILDSLTSIRSLSGKFAYDLKNISVRDLNGYIPHPGLNINNSSFDADFTGQVGNFDSLAINLRSYTIHTANSSIFGSAKVKQLNAPSYIIDGRFKFDLAEISSLLPDTLIQEASGTVTLDLKSSGEINPDSIARQWQQLVFENSSLSSNFNKVSVKTQDKFRSIKNFTGKIDLTKDGLSVNKTRGTYADIDFKIDSTTVRNLYETIFKHQDKRLLVNTSLSIGKVDHKLLSVFMAGDSSTNTPNEEVEPKSENTPTPTPLSYGIKGKLAIESLRYKNARAESVSALFNLSDSLYLIDQLNFNGFGGKVSTSVRYEPRGTDKVFWVKNTIEKMNVTTLLQDFNNFSDFYKPAITHENLSGILSTEFHSQIFLTGDSLIREKLRVKGNILIEKGAIYNYPPVQKTADLIPGIDNLDILEFKTIDTKLFIIKDSIFVPFTFIASNKLDASGIGGMRLGGDYVHLIDVFLGDLIFGKNDRQIKKQDKKGDVIMKSDRKGGTNVKVFSINGEGKVDRFSKDERDTFVSEIKSNERLLRLRFYPDLVNYNTNVK